MCHESNSIRQIAWRIVWFLERVWFGNILQWLLKSDRPERVYRTCAAVIFWRWSYYPIFATAFGDIITWEDNKYIGILKYRYQDSDIISTGFEDFFEEVEEGILDDDYFTIKKYNAAVKKYGELEYDECFGYVPLLALGGKSL